MTSAEILTAAERCARAGVWASQWQSHRMQTSDMVRRAVSAALCSTAKNPGEYAGEEVMTLATNRGVDNHVSRIYDCVLNHAAIADIVTTAILQTPAKFQALNGSIGGWSASSLLSGERLIRFIPVSSWNPERQAHESRSWFALGEVCRLNMPMQMIVAVMGQMNGSRRHGYWSRALMHPRMSEVRFKKRSRSTIEGFKETWMPIFREEHDEIERRTWLQGMLEDGVLRESLLVVDVPVPGEIERLKIVDLGRRKLEAQAMAQELPGKNLSTCDGPLAPCPFRRCCWAETETQPSEPTGFDAVP